MKIVGKLRLKYLWPEKTFKLKIRAKSSSLVVFVIKNKDLWALAQERARK